MKAQNQAPALSPTEAQFKAYQQMFDYFNLHLFEDKLPACLLNLSRMNKALGFFAPERWKKATDEDGIVAMGEISLNPDHMSRGHKDGAGTLIHEMCHLQRRSMPGKQPRGGYHDKPWAEMMLAVGLIPRSIDQPGKMTGNKVTHDIEEGGAFEKAFDAMPKEFLLPFSHIRIEDKNAKAKTASKTKYTCPECETNAWAKPDTNLMCGDCECKMKAKDE
jgi:predicted SprT family Zn-dependent metalloprotease